MKTLGWPNLIRLEVGTDAVAHERFFCRVVEHIEHVQQQLDARLTAKRDLREPAGRAATATTAAACRAARAARAATPCGSRLAAAAHGLPLNYCRLAATTNPVRGTSTLPIMRNTCGRSFGRRPRALVRSFGSRPKVMARGRCDVLTCAPAGAVPLDACRPLARRKRVRSERLPAMRSTFLRHDDQAVVGQRIAVWIGEDRSAVADRRQQLEHRICRPSARGITVSRYSPLTSAQPMKLAPSFRT